MHLDLPSSTRLNEMDRRELGKLASGIIPGLAVAACLALSVAFAMLPSRLHAMGFAALAGLVASLVLLRWPALGLLAVVPMALVVPFSIRAGTGNALSGGLLAVGLLTGLWLLALATRQARLEPSRPVIAAVVFAILVLLSLLAAQVSWRTGAESAPIRVQLGGAGLYLLSIAAFLLVGHQMRDVRWLQALVWLFLAVASIRVFGWFMPGMRSRIVALFPSDGSGAAGALFWNWLVALAFSQALCNRRLGWPLRIALALLVAAALYIGLGPRRDWTSGWMPALTATLVILWLWRPGLTIGLIAFAGPTLYLARGAIANSLLLVGGEYGNEWSMITRFAAWTQMINVIKLSPFLGIGLANYFWYDAAYGIMGYNVPFIAHNQYLDILAQMGIVGMVGFLWLTWEITRLGWRLREQTSVGSFERAYVYGALGGLAGTLASGVIGDWFLPFAYNLGLTGFRSSVFAWLFLGGLVALDWQVARRKDHHGDAA